MPDEMLPVTVSVFPVDPEERRSIAHDMNLSQNLRLAEEIRRLREGLSATLDALVATRSRVTELETERTGMHATEWGVRYPTGTDVPVRDEREAWERASVRPGRTVLTRTAPGPWRVAST